MVKKISVLAMVGLMLAAGSALATDTRVLTMGENGNVMMDETNVMMYPQTLAKWQNLGVINITGGGITSAGTHMAYGGATYGSYWMTEEWQDDYLHDFNGDGVTGIDQKFSMIYARDLGGLPFGFSFSLYGNKDEHKNDNNPSYSGMGLKLGAGVTLMERLETSFQFGMLSWEAQNPAGAVTAENDGGTSIMVMARYWHEMSEGMTVIPHFTLDMNSAGSKPSGGGASTTDAEMMIEVGIGDNMQIGEKLLLVEDIGLRFRSGTHDAAGTETEWSDNATPYFSGGMEVAVSEKFVFRFGGVKEWSGTTMKTGNVEHNTSGAATRMYIGAAYVRGPFSIDMNVNPGFFTNGPYLITGAGGPWASQVSMQYYWGK